MTPEENERLTRVGPGTPVGEMLRRYWWPVWFSEQVSTTPVPVRVLGEDLVLFRDGSGRTALLDRRCPHRGASLELGRVEADGIRCCYHGWKFDRAGYCLDMPCEPENTPLKDEVRQTAYATEEAAGLVFAYLGPEPAPVLPRYDLFFGEGLQRTVGAEIDHCNWLQRAENTVDQMHATVLHAAGYPELALQRPKIDWSRTWYGVRSSYELTGGAAKVSHFIFPASNRYFGARIGDTSSQNMHIRTPVDDTATMTFYIRAKESRDTDKRLVTKGLTVTTPGVYERVEDGWWGLPNREQDRAAQESQGRIADRTREILATSDRGVVMFRRMLAEGVAAVERGEDPAGVVRTSADELIMFDAKHVRDGEEVKA
jgi:5,5'-dehydrodivanillate O-demethylase